MREFQYLQVLIIGNCFSLVNVVFCSREKEKKKREINLIICGKGRSKMKLHR